MYSMRPQATSSLLQVGQMSIRSNFVIYISSNCNKLYVNLLSIAFFLVGAFQIA